MTTFLIYNKIMYNTYYLIPNVILIILLCRHNLLLILISFGSFSSIPPSCTIPLHYIEALINILRELMQMNSIAVLQQTSTSSSPPPPPSSSHISVPSHSIVVIVVHYVLLFLCVSRIHTQQVLSLYLCVL